MKKIINCTILTAILTICLAGTSLAVAFAPGNLVVCRIGAVGGGALNAAAFPVFLDEYTTAGALVQSIALPTTDDGPNQTLTLAGSATSECLMTRSADGRYIFVFGYDAAVGTAAVAGTTTTAVLRVIARVGQDGIVSTGTTTTSFSAGNPRGIVSSNGTDIWLSGSNTGVVYTTFGSSGTGTIVANGTTNLRSLNIFDGQLYVSSASGTLRMGTVGAGLPTTTGQVITSLTGFPTGSTSPYPFFFADLTPAVAGVDTLYIADDTAAIGLQKWSLVAGTWTLNGAVTPGIRGLAGIHTNSPTPNTVTLYGTSTANSANTLSVYVDSSGYNARPTPVKGRTRTGEFLPGTPTLLATASANTVFRNVAFAPLSATAATASISGRVTETNGRPIANATLVIAGGNLSEPITVVTGSFGYYNVPDLPAGQNYVISVSAKRHRFNDASQVVSLTGDLVMDFVANQ